MNQTFSKNLSSEVQPSDPPISKTAHRAKNATVIKGYFDNGNRAFKRVILNGSEESKTLYVHDGVHVIAEYSATGQLQKEYLYSNNIDEILSSSVIASEAPL